MWHTTIHFNSVFRQRHILIAGEDKGRCLYGADRSIGYVGKMLHPACALVEHHMKRILAGIDGQERLLVFVRHVFEIRVVHALPEFGRYTGPFVHGRGDDKAIDYFMSTHRTFHRSVPPIATFTTPHNSSLA